jgi:acetyl-CoA C-acetyltransferase
MEKLASLKVLHPEIEGFSVTAGNASGINDAAAALTIVDGDLARSEGLTPLATIRSWASAGIDPRLMGMAPLQAIPKVLARAGVKQSDIAIWEINEAFASVPVAACKVLGIDEEIVNIHGSGCSLGHPIAATGARMLTTLINDLRRRGGGLGIATMCAGGGQAGAVLVEVLSDRTERTQARSPSRETGPVSVRGHGPAGPSRRARIRPSWTTVATSRPCRSVIRPSLKVRPLDAEGDAWS